MKPQPRGEFILDPKWRISAVRFSPFGLPPSKLWVRETFWERKDHISSHHDLNAIRYDADLDQTESDCRIGWAEHSKCRPSIHMPRWVSRITLEITDVRVERIRDISKKDAEAEGYTNDPIPDDDPISWYIWLWDSINAKKGYGWEVNPWVWCICFKVIK